MLALARKPRIADAELDSALIALVDELATALDDLDASGRAALFAAELLLRVREGSEDDEALAELAREMTAEHRTWTVIDLAVAHLGAGALERAETLARFGCEQDPDPALEPHLWYLRAEVARKLGRWDQEALFLDRMEASIRPDAELEDGPRRAELVARNHEHRSRLFQGRAHVLLGLGLLDLCREPLERALEEAQLSGEPSALVAARLLAFDRALIRGGAGDEAVELMVAGRADERLTAWHPFFRYCEGRAEILRARSALDAGADPQPAAERARAAIGEALAAGMSRTVELEAEIRLGDLERMLGRAQEARAHAGRARELARELGRDVPPDQGALLAALAWRLAYDARAPAQELDARRAELGQAYRAFLEHWRSTPLRPGGIGFLHVAWRSEIVSVAIDAELAAGGDDREERAFERLLQAQALGTRAREHSLTDVGLDDIRSTLLAEKRGMLVLLPTRDRSHLFVLDLDTLEHVPIAHDRVTLRDESEAVAAALQSGRVADAASLQRLHDALVPPSVRAELATWTGAITVGFDLVRGLPFGILGGESGAPYARRLALTSLPSPAFGVYLARRGSAAAAQGGAGSPERGAAPAGTRAGGVVLVVAGDPPRELALPPFTFGDAERRQLLGVFGSDVLVCEGSGASRESLFARRDRVRGARLVHFLTHAVALPGREFSTALVLSGAAPPEERLLLAEDVARLELSGLVILSACGSSRGPTRTGDDSLVHLGGAFLDAGARCVILARFPVEYGATLELMSHVHARLAAGDSPAEALRAARAGGSEAVTAGVSAFEVLGLGFEPLH